MEKLVRDKIPEMLLKMGKNFETRTADDEEYWKFLKEKLKEEVQEFLESEEKEELADILEVIHAICKFKGWDIMEIEDIRKRKREERGGFNKKIILKLLEKDP